MKIKILDYKELNYALSRVIRSLNENGNEVKSLDDLKKQLTENNGMIYYFWDGSYGEEFFN